MSTIQSGGLDTIVEAVNILFAGRPAGSRNDPADTSGFFEALVQNTFLTRGLTGKHHVGEKRIIDTRKNASQFNGCVVKTHYRATLIQVRTLSGSLLDAAAQLLLSLRYFALSWTHTWKKIAPKITRKHLIKRARFILEALLLKLALFILYFLLFTHTNKIH